MNDDRDLWIILGSVLMGVPVVFALIISGIMLFADRPACNVTGEAMNIPHHWGWWTGCMVEIDGRWIPLDAYKVIRPTQG